MQQIDLCPSCMAHDPECPTCEGRGKWRIYRCPGATVEPWATELVLHARMAQEHAVFPDGRPFLEQTAWFVAAAMLVWSEYAKTLKE